MEVYFFCSGPAQEGPGHAIGDLMIKRPNKVQEDMKMAVHGANILKAQDPEATQWPGGVNHQAMTCSFRVNMFNRVSMILLVMIKHVCNDN